MISVGLRPPHVTCDSQFLILSMFYRRVKFEMHFISDLSKLSKDLLSKA